MSAIRVQCAEEWSIPTASVSRAYKWDLHIFFDEAVATKGEEPFAQLSIRSEVRKEKFFD